MTSKALTVPAVALGTWAWGDSGEAGAGYFGSQLSEPGLREVAEKAHSNGFTLWDTAVAYGMGRKRTGTLFPPVTGRFQDDGTGVFYGDDEHDGRKVPIRFIWSEITENTAHWEQAFFVDGEQSWITNWHMHMTRRVA